MEIVKRLGRMREVAHDLRGRGETVAFVPTMGALHDGHLSLVRHGRELADRVVMSVFVNPTQFGANEDLAAYPRDLARDSELGRSAGVDYLFVPEAREMYADGYATYVRVEGLEDRLCGRSRPGHFRGVATVVAKLLHIVAPDFALFGEKDAQQLVILRRMVADLNLPVEVVGCPTVREADGLAMSSRNAYLDPEERRVAACLYRSLEQARLRWEEGERRGPALVAAMRAVIHAEPQARLEYAEAVDPATLEPVEEIEGETLCAIAVHIGPARLIDNLTLGEPRKLES
jgi:pantoate--beta-alanine ligase